MSERSQVQNEEDKYKYYNTSIRELTNAVYKDEIDSNVTRRLDTKPGWQ